MISVGNEKHNVKRKLQIWGFSFLVATGLLLRCSDENVVKQISQLRYEINGEAQGTTYNIVYFTDSLVVQKREIDSILYQMDLAASIWVDHSVISQVNQNQQTRFPIENDDFHFFEDNFNLSKQVYHATQGAYNPTVGRLVNAWGFGFKNKEKMDSTKVDSLLVSVGFDDNQMWVEKGDSLIFNKVNPQSNLDFNGIAQGYSVDVLANYFLSVGIENYMIEVGGELIAHGKKADGSLWKIGIDQPVEGNYERVLSATIKLENVAVATSGNYRKFYEEDGMRYSHTINPFTGFPVQHSLLSATVVMNNCGLADAFATSFMVLGVEKSKEVIFQNPELGINVYLIYSDENGALHTYTSSGLKKHLEEL